MAALEATPRPADLKRMRNAAMQVYPARKGSRQIVGQSQSCMVVAAAAAAVVVVVGVQELEAARSMGAQTFQRYIGRCADQLVEGAFPYNP